jgi:pyruvate/oxaloacetate carboxyltransferase
MKIKRKKSVTISPMVVDFVKMEIAQEMGIHHLELFGGADLPSKVTGYLGQETKRRILEMVRSGTEPEELEEIARGKKWI